MQNECSFNTKDDYWLLEKDLKIKESRKDAGLTQEEFSKLFEIPIDVVKSWDSGRRQPPKWAEKLVIEKLEQIKSNTI